MSFRLLAVALFLHTALAVAQTPGPDLPPPVAPKQAQDVSVHGDRRIDDYFWLRHRDDPRVLDYLKAENAYSDAWLAPRLPLRDALYQETLGRIQQDDETVPYRKGAWWYGSRTLEGKQYPIHTRHAAKGPARQYDADAPEQVLLDLNAMAVGKSFLSLGLFSVTSDGSQLAFSTDETGARDFLLQVKNLTTGQLLPWSMPKTDGAAWGNSAPGQPRVLYYVTTDDAKRADKLWRHVFGSDRPDALVYEERDPLFSLGIDKTRDGRYLLLTSESKDVSETRLIDADRPDATPRVVFPREPQRKYSVDHRAGQLYVRINDTGRNYRLVRVDARRPDLAQATELIAARDDLMIQAVAVFKRHLVVYERVAGLLQLRVRDLATGRDHRIAFDEPAYTVKPAENPEFDTTSFRFSYTSLTTPLTVYDEDLMTRERTLKKRQPVLGGFDLARYATERFTATAADGMPVPISLVYRKDRRTPGAPQPLLLYGYGSYGIPMDPMFSSPRLSLLDRGVVFAIAHIRGGGDLGTSWYEAAKMALKATTFTDFVSCAEALVARGWTAPDKLIIQGGSAGGLLMGAVVNLRPELFKAVVAQVPFVDIVNTMLDETLPLTTEEFVEWGNPKLPDQYRWIRAYSPYDNLKPGAFPAMLVETGINDSQVPYWEPSKYVAKLRTLKTDPHLLLLRVNLGAGHGGASGRFDKLKEQALELTFMLDQWGLAR